MTDPDSLPPSRASESEVLIDARGLARRYGQHSAVERLDLQLLRGEVLGLLGPNGAGKTTSLRMLTGSLAPDAGSVRIAGVAMAEDPRRAKAMLGYLPETPPLHPELKVAEYLRFCAGLHGIRRTQAEAAVTHAMSACGLTTVAGQLIGSLSKGYQQRVGIAQAIVHKPAVIVLDEPTVGLDPNQMREIRALIQQLAERHAVILSSHILSEVQAVCSRVLILSLGRVVYDGPLDDVQGDDSSPLNLLVGMRRPPALERLKSFSGVIEVEPEDAHHVRLRIAPDHDPREAIVLQAAALDWGLFELHLERPRLEDVFAELTA